MSANLVYSLEDEKPNLKKQIGCINRLFHLYDRHRFLSRRIKGSNHKRLPPVGESGNQAVQSSTTHQNATQKDQNKVFKEIRRNSTESTRALVSSSSSSPSSFSPVDYAKSLQVEPCVSSPTISTETASIHELLTNRPNFTIQSSKQCLSLGDVVRDSMHREARGIAVKTTAKDEAVVRTLTCIDSPRPSTPPKSVKPRLSDLSESFQVFAKLPEATRSSNKERDGCMHWAPKEFPRLSYDGRETHKSTINLKELPRLSLDSRAGSLRDSNSVIKGNCDQTIDLRQEPGRSKRSSSIIAKLMGLEALPNSTSTNGCQSRFDNNYQTEGNDSLSATLKDIQHSYSGSQKNAKKDLASNQMKNVDLVVVEATSSQNFPLETAPWKQIYGSKGSQSPDSKCHEAPPKAINSSSPSVHGEIEKRISELEFKWSGKDLRALKQVLEAMQKTKEDSKKDETSSFKSRMSNNSSLYCNSLLEIHESIPSDISISPRASDPPKTYKSPIIMKPAKLHRENSDPASAGSFDSLTRTRKLQTSHSTFHEKEPKHPTQKNAQLTKCRTGGQSSRDKSTNTNTSKYVQASKTPQNNREGNSCHSDKITRTVTYDPKHKQFGSDKQPRQVIPSSDSSKTRRHHNRLNIESSRLARKDMSESPNLQRSKDRLRETKTNMRYLSNQSDALSIQSESGISLDSHTFKETNFEHDGKDQRDPAVGLSEAEAEAGKASGEQPSPVSVLDATFYRDNLPSPVKKKSIAFEDDETLYPDEVKWQIMDLAQQSSRESCVSSEIDIKTLEHIKNLVQNPQQTNFSEAKTPICHPIILQYDSTNPDHRYILYILLASELYGYLDSGLINIRFQKLDHIINPKLFFAFEQVKASTKLSHDDNRCENLLLKYDQTIHRKLVFDVVNEILCHKLVAVDSLKQCLVQKSRQQHLVGKLCREIDRLQGRDLNGNLVHENDNMRSIIPEDLMDWSGCECDSEISGVVLDIERLIFKDLITEVATGMTAVSQFSPINVSSNT